MALPWFENKTSILISMPKITTEWQRFEVLGADGLYELLRFRQGIFVVEQCSPFRDLDGLDLEARHLLLRAEGALAGYLRMIPRRCGSAESLLPLHCGAAGSDEG